MSHSEVKTKTVYISIGNSDDKLTQFFWSNYWNDVNSAIESLSSAIHGVWFSASESEFQNAAWCIELDDFQYKTLKEELETVRKQWNQDSIAWAVAETEFI